MNEKEDECSQLQSLKSAMLVTFPYSIARKVILTQPKSNLCMSIFVKTPHIIRYACFPFLLISRLGIASVSLYTHIQLLLACKTSKYISLLFNSMPI